MRIVGFEEKPAEPKSNYVAYAVYIYPKTVLPEIKNYLDEGNSNDAPGNLIGYLYNKVPSYAYAFTEECYDVGTHDSLAYVNEIYSKK